MTRLLAEMTWPEVVEAVAAGSTTVILPLGATEQHGPHLPLATDTVRAAALADRLSVALGTALVAPPLPFGCSDEHWGFAGLIGLDHETLATVIVDCGRRLAGWGITRLVVLSAHGGNARALDLATSRLADEVPSLGLVVLGGAAAHPDDILAIADADGIRKADVGLHAGEGETSEMLALRPDLVRMGRVGPGYADDAPGLIGVLERHGLRAVTSTGVLGDAQSADGDRGRRYIEAQIDTWRRALAASPPAVEARPA